MLLKLVGIFTYEKNSIKNDIYHFIEAEKNDRIDGYGVHSLFQNKTFKLEHADLGKDFDVIFDYKSGYVYRVDRK